MNEIKVVIKKKWDGMGETVLERKVVKNIIASRCATIGINHIIFMYALATD